MSIDTELLRRAADHIESQQRVAETSFNLIAGLMKTMCDHLQQMQAQLDNIERMERQSRG